MHHLVVDIHADPSHQTLGLYLHNSGSDLILSFEHFISPGSVKLSSFTKFHGVEVGIWLALSQSLWLLVC